MFSEWSPERAEALARLAGLGGLGERHWRVIASAREDAARRGRAPRLRRIEALTGLAAGELHALFPGETETLITRIAGCERPELPGARIAAGDPEEE